MRDEIIYKNLSFKITGILFRVHNELGRHRSEKSYGDKFELLLKEEGLNFLREYNLPPSFTGENKNRNRVDFIIEDKIIIDLKAKDFVTKEDYYQMLRYLTALKKKLGLIINFRKKFLKPKRIINSDL